MKRDEKEMVDENKYIYTSHLLPHLRISKIKKSSKSKNLKRKIENIYLVYFES